MRKGGILIGVATALACPCGRVQRVSNHFVVKELQYVCTIPWALIERVKEETSSRTQNTKLVIITNDAMHKSDKVVRVSDVGY